jgi:S-formylglutathione hydrolase FrmB
MERQGGDQGSKEQLESWYKKHSAIELINAIDPEELQKQRQNQVRWYIDCGDDDFLFEGNSLAHIAMRKKEIPHEFRIRDGGHTWTYWRESLPEVLSFISAAFHQH